jgi:hypothetical protein
MGLMAALAWFADRIVVQNANKIISRLGADDLVAKLFPRRKGPALTMSASAFELVNAHSWRAGSDLLYLTLVMSAHRTVRIERIAVLFNSPGRTGSCELQLLNPARILHAGEIFQTPLLHYKEKVGTFWGTPGDFSESRTLDGMSRDGIARHIEALLLSPGPYYSQVVVTCADAEYRYNFTVLNPVDRRQPAVVCPNDHKEYDPGRHIPSPPHV